MTGVKTLPTFLGVGAQKAGTTWLHAQLEAHPEVYVPTLRKEVHFFDVYFEKGVAWYAGFFPDAPDEAGYRHWGEVTPEYLFDPLAPERIASLLGLDTRIIMILRDPVERLFSQYRMSYSRGDTNLGPADFAHSNDQALRRGLYAAQVSRYLSRFGEDKVLVLFYEQLFSSGEQGVPKSLLRVGKFLDLDNAKWPTVEYEKRVGASASAGRPRFAGLYGLARRCRRWCMDRDLEKVVQLAKKTGISSRAFGGLIHTPEIGGSLKNELWQAYRDDVGELERVLGMTIDFWGPGAGGEGR